MVVVVEMNSMLDEKMMDVFDWSDFKLFVWDVIWNYFMDVDSYDIDKMVDEVVFYMSMDEVKFKSEVEKFLKV